MNYKYFLIWSQQIEEDRNSCREWKITSCKCWPRLRCGVVHTKIRWWLIDIDKRFRVPQKKCRDVKSMISAANWHVQNMKLTAHRTNYSLDRIGPLLAFEKTLTAPLRPESSSMNYGPMIPSADKPDHSIFFRESSTALIMPLVARRSKYESFVC